ncbi:unnamed protein product [Discosporangium mesarthrocarpum]
MIGILERATGQADLVPMQQAETLFVSQLGMSKPHHHEAWAEVYKYWKDKRARNGKPLLRRFWPVTSPNDTDPHKVFRPREKERYKLRKHRKNDLESFRKLQQVKQDFERLLHIATMVQRRETMKRAALLIQSELFEQAYWDLTDTTGQARPLNLSPGDYKLKLRVPAAADRSQDRPKEEKERVRKPSKRRKDRSSRDTVAVGNSTTAAAVAGGAGPEEVCVVLPLIAARLAAAAEHCLEGGGVGGGGKKLHVSVLPSFMDEFTPRSCPPINSVVEPSLTTYTTPTGKGVPPPGVEPLYMFKLRARIGRGGRVMWDRVPVRGAPPPRADGLVDPDDPPFMVHTNYTHCPREPTAIHMLHPPMVNLQLDERRYREICAMEDDQEEMLEPLGLGTAESAAAGAAEATALSKLNGMSSLPRIKYTIEV